MQPHRDEIMSAQRSLGHHSADANPEAERLKRVHLRSQTKQREQEALEKQAKKKAKLEGEEDFLKSVTLTSPFVRQTPELSEQERTKWAIEWTEFKTLSKLPDDLNTIDKRAEIFQFLRSPALKQNAVIAYFGLGATSFYKYLKKFRESREGKERVQKLQQPVRQQQEAGSSAAHASSLEIDASAAAPSSGLDSLEFKHSGRQAAFSEDSIHAAKIEFAARVTGPKRGMTCEAMVEMLIRLRQLHQAEPFEVLPIVLIAKLYFRVLQ
jgi:hypothetical protein